jgi:hypothetical protein
MFSNIIPIQRALSKNLRTSLDLYHRAVTEVTVSVKRVEDMGLSVNQLVVGITLVVMGVLTYYVAPMSFIFKNYTLFFFILNVVLIFMILGMSFVAMIVLPYVQNLFLIVMVSIFKKDRKLYPLVKKNMTGHAARNTKTAMMFTIALSFLIFSGSTFQLIAHLIQSTLMSTFSADFYISSEYSSNYLDESALVDFLQIQKDLDGSVISWTFQAPELGQFLSSISPNYKTNF